MGPQPYRTSGSDSAGVGSQSAVDMDCCSICMALPRNICQRGCRKRTTLVALLLPGEAKRDRMFERLCCGLCAGIGRGLAGHCRHAGTKDPDHVGPMEDLTNLIAQCLAAFAFRAWEGADQKDDGDSVGVRAGGQPAVELSRGEMPGVELLSAQEPHQQLGGKIVG